MPIVLESDPVGDLEADALEVAMDDGEVAAEMGRFGQPLGDVGDLSRGGKAGGVNVYPNPSRDDSGRMRGNGRPTVRMAWMWDGTESTVPLGWNPEGTEHDGGRKYLSKKHCHCCGYSGFRFTRKLRGCPNCMKNNCPRCQGGQNRSKVIPCFYFKKDQVPYPKDAGGDIDCFVVTCVRRNGDGFKDESSMWMHARGKHRMEYQAYRDSQQTEDKRELAQLREQVALLTAAAIRGSPSAEGAPAVLQPKDTADAPLYVSDNPQRNRKR